MSDSAPPAAGPPASTGTGPHGRPIIDSTAPVPRPARSGDTVWLDTEAAATPVARLDEALERLTGTLAALQRFHLPGSPAEDHVSRRIAENNQRMLINAHDYVQALRDRVEAARDALREQIASYERADDPRIFRP